MADRKPPSFGTLEEELDEGFLVFEDADPNDPGDDDLEEEDDDE